MRRLFLVAMCAFPSICPTVHALDRDLTFEGRVNVKEAIECFGRPWLKILPLAAGAPYPLSAFGLGLRGGSEPIVARRI